MLHYMQMRNWFLIFLALVITCLVHQKMNALHDKNLTHYSIDSYSVQLSPRAQSFLADILD